MKSYVERLAELVDTDSGSRDLPGLARAAELLRQWCEQSGLEVTLYPVCDPDRRPLGDVLVARVAGTGSRRVLLAGHLDTVFAPGTAAARPFTVEGDRALGPGVSDDKGGLLAGLSAIERVLTWGTTFGELVLVATPDEEIGSIGSRPLLEQLAAEADVALCLECARENGDLVSARKGIADVEIVLSGRAAHAGIEPERGANAALAAALLTVEVQALNGIWPDVTVNVGVMRAGERPNVVAAQATLLVDLRAANAAHFDAALHRIRELAAQSYVEGVAARVLVHAPAPPWELTAAGVELAELAVKTAADLGIELGHTATGGCADANLLAACGIPVLDGLGPIGGDDHSPGEWLDLASVEPRVALLAVLIDRLCRRRTIDG